MYNYLTSASKRPKSASPTSRRQKSSSPRSKQAGNLIPNRRYNNITPESRMLPSNIFWHMIGDKHAKRGKSLVKKRQPGLKGPVGYHVYQKEGKRHLAELKSTAPKRIQEARRRTMNAGMKRVVKYANSMNIDIPQNIVNLIKKHN